MTTDKQPCEGPTGKRYEIDTFDKLINVANSENIERLSIDFLIWINSVTKMFDSIREKHPEFKDRPNSEIAKVAFIWLDDGKNIIKEFHTKNTETGEINTFKPKKKNGK